MLDNGDAEDSCRPDFEGAAKQSRYVASSSSYSTKHSESKHQVLCLAGQFVSFCIST